MQALTHKPNSVLLDLVMMSLEKTNASLTLCDINNDFPVIYVNRAFEETTGYSFSEIEGKNLRFLQGPETDRKTVREIGTSIRQGRPVSLPILNYKKDGDQFINHLELSPLHDAQGNIVAYCGFQFDCTHYYKEKETELSYQKEKLKVLESMSFNIAKMASVILQPTETVSRQLRQSPNQQEVFLEGLDDVVHGISRAQELMEYLQEMVSENKANDNNC